jgi:hypothetical protein
MRTSWFKNRRLVALGGAGLALGSGLALAIVLAERQNSNDDAPPASVGGLVVQTSHDAVAKLDPARPLRCFVGGRLIGELTVIDCAKRNGVATGALDVGVDSSGGFAAARTPPVQTLPEPPPPPTDGPSVPTTLGDPSDAESQAGGQPCWGYSSGNWSRSPGAMSLGSCVRSLFAGQCVSPGAAAYGRWGGKTLRLALGRVEIASDGRSFHTLTQQQGACELSDAQ